MKIDKLHFHSIPEKQATPTKKTSPLTKIFHATHTADSSQYKTIKDLKGVVWKSELVLNPNAPQESGATKQGKVKLTSSDGSSIEARVKEIKTLNEAIVYHQINQQDKVLSGLMPQFITVLDKNGNSIDISHELAKCGNSIEELCKKQEFKPAYLLIRDLVNELEEVSGKQVSTEEIKDLKLVRPSLQGIEIERKLHGYSPSNFVTNAIRKAFFKLSGCSFAFQKGTKSEWYTVVINNIKRIMTLAKTRLTIQNEFKKLPVEQLQAVVGNLQKLRTAMKNSDYAFSDASLLLLPSVRKKNTTAVNELEIRLIDMSHALAKQEIQQKIDKTQKALNSLELAEQKHTIEYKQNSAELHQLEQSLHDFEVMKLDMEQSLLEMEEMLVDMLQKK